MLALAGQGGFVLAQGVDGSGAAETEVPALPTTIDPVPADPVDIEPVDPVAASDLFPDTAPVEPEIQSTTAPTAAPAPVGPQAPPAGPVVVFGLGTGLRADEDGLASRSSLDVTFRSRTREQYLELGLGTAVDLDSDGFDSSETFPDADVTYVRDTGVLLLSLFASYSVDEINGSIPGPDFVFDETDVIADDGTRETTRLGAGFEIGRRDLIGLEFDTIYQSRDFEDTDDPDLTDTETFGYEGALRFTVGPTLVFRLTGLLKETEDGGILDAKETETSYGGQLAWQATPTTAVDFALAQTRIETDRNETVEVVSAFTDQLVERIATGERETIRQEGLETDLALTRRLPNGTAGLTLGRDLTVNGGIGRAALQRRLSLASGGDLRLSFGAGHFEGSDTFALMNLRYSQPLPLGELTASLQRDGFVDSDEQNVIRTRATIGHVRPITPLSAVSLSLGLASIDVVDGFEADQVAADLEVSYRRDLGRDWALDMGYQGTVSREDDQASDSESTVFVNLNRTFTFRP